jgi:hypothetical protein
MTDFPKRGIVNQLPGGLPWNWMLHFLAIKACSTATISGFAALL